MSSLIDRIVNIYRDWIVSGVRTPGAEWEPRKSEIRGVLSGIVTAMSTLGLTGSLSKVKMTKSLLDADLVAAADSLGLVWGDGTAANNGFYVKVGSSGSGSWTNTGLIIPATLADQIEELATAYESIAEDLESAATAATTATSAASAAAASQAVVVSKAAEVGLDAAAAQVAADAAAAAADVTGPAAFYDTKAAATADLASIAADATVEIAADESRGGKRARYKKESGVLVFKLLMLSASDLARRQRSLIYNYKATSMIALRTAMAATRTQGSRCRIAHIGDSETMGLGSGGDGYVNGRLGAYPTRLALYLNDMMATGARFTYDDVFGNNNADNYDTYNPRVVIGAGWAPGGGTSVGGPYWVNTTTTNSWGYYTGAGYTTTVWVWYIDGAGMTMTVDIGGSTLATITGTGTNTIKGIIVGWERAAGVNVFIRRVSGPCYFLGLEAFDASVGSISLLNMGWSGAKSEEWTRTTYAPDPNYTGNYETLNLDAAFVMLGVNDCYNGVSVATYKANMKTLCQRLKAAGTSVLLITPIPFSISHKTLAVQQTYVDALYEVSDEEDVPLFDMFQRFGSYELGSSVGMYADTIHPNAMGYMDVARPLADIAFNP